jgi:hypothetical protein
VTSPPEDFVDMLRELRAASCDFIVVGAYALAANGYPRATQDIDILVRPDADNAVRVYRALVAYGAPVQAHGVTPQDFEKPGTVYQIGLPPVRIDLLTSVAGLDFAAAASGAHAGEIGGEPVRFLGIDDQIVNKRAAGRTKDLADAEALEAIRSERASP